MTGRFDPAGLQAITALSDDSVVVTVEGEELRRMKDAEVRRRCAALRLASRIIGMAAAERLEMPDGEVLASMTAIMQRMAELRPAALAVLGISRDSEDFPLAFNAATSAVLDAVVEEWRWSKAAGDAPALSVEAIKALMGAMVKLQPERFELAAPLSELAAVRRVCILEATPRLLGIVNFFDYFHADPQAVVRQLLMAVAEQAEQHAKVVLAEAGPLGEERPILHAMYGISTSLMCEVYKACALRDVQRMREMPELDRSVVTAQYEHIGGMKFDHVIEAHRGAMARAQDVANVIAESTRKQR